MYSSVFTPLYAQLSIGPYIIIHYKKKFNGNNWILAKTYIVYAAQRSKDTRRLPLEGKLAPQVTDEVER
jgi:hypothetical protein